MHDLLRRWGAAKLRKADRESRQHDGRPAISVSFLSLLRRPAFGYSFPDNCEGRDLGGRRMPDGPKGKIFMDYRRGGELAAPFILLGLAIAGIATSLLSPPNGVFIVGSLRLAYTSLAFTAFVGAGFYVFNVAPAYKSALAALIFLYATIAISQINPYQYIGISLPAMAGMNVIYSLVIIVAALAAVGTSRLEAISQYAAAYVAARLVIMGLASALPVAGIPSTIVRPLVTALSYLAFALLILLPLRRRPALG